MAGARLEATMHPSNTTRIDRKERMMEAQDRLQIINSYQQQLRDQAVAQRLTRGGRSAFRPSHPDTWFPRTIGALRRLVGSMA